MNRKKKPSNTEKYFISFHFINTWLLPVLPPKPPASKAVWLTTPAPESFFSSYYASTQALVL
jgi:hypothetical protein